MPTIAIVACLPIYYGVEQRMLRVKLRFAAEKEVLDLNTGKMVSIEQARAMHRGMVSAEAVEGDLSPDPPAGAPPEARP